MTTGITAPSRLTANEEIELKLTVIGGEAERVLSDLASVPIVGEYSFGSAEPRLIRDVYWDTPDFQLRRLGLTLRLREENGRPKFTAKCGIGAAEGLFRREELEVPADRDGWATLWLAFAHEGLRLGLPEPPGGSPTEWLRDVPLTVTQDRRTERLVRIVSRHDQPLAELALDTTHFDLGDSLVTYHEIEVEQLPGRSVDLFAIGDALNRRYPGQLEPSTMSKYARGLALAGYTDFPISP
jgi:inorganic triphosphatase YgiF